MSSQENIAIAVFVGILMIIVPVSWIQSDIAKEKLLARTQTATTQATIIRTEPGNHNAAYWQFVLNGKIYTGDDHIADMVKPGDFMEVRYNPQDPSQNSPGFYKPMTLGGYIMVSGMIDFFILGSSILMYASMTSKSRRS